MWLKMSVGPRTVHQSKTPQLMGWVQGGEKRGADRGTMATRAVSL